MNLELQLQWRLCRRYRVQSVRAQSHAHLLGLVRDHLHGVRRRARTAAVSEGQHQMTVPAPIFPLTATFVFRVSGILPARLQAELKETPGVQWNGYRREITASMDVAWAIVGLLQAARIEIRDVGTPSGNPPIGREELDEQIRLNPAIPSWLLDGSGDEWRARGFRGPISLYDFQKRAVAFGLEREGALLKAPAGAGKTAMSVVWSALITGASGIVLVVTKSTVVTQFARAIRAFAEEAVVDVLELHAPAETVRKLKDEAKVWNPRKDEWVIASEVVAADEQVREAKALNPDAPLLYVVVGWDSLALHLDALLKVPINAIIFDESQFGKQPKRMDWAKSLQGDWTFAWKDNRSTAAFRLAQQTPFKLAMTATPIPDRRIDLYGQLTLIAPGANEKASGPWGVTYSKFATRYCGARKGDFGGLDMSGATNTEELEGRLSFCRFAVTKTETHAELPPYSIELRYLAPSEQDRPGAGFKAALSRLARLSAKGESGSRQDLEEMLLMEAASRKRSVVLDEVSGAVEPDGETGDPALGRGKVMIFTGRHRDCWELHAAITGRLGKARATKGIQTWCGVDPKWGVDEEGLSITKGTPKGYSLQSMTARQDLQDLYMAHPGPCVLVVTGEAWGTGLDLQDTDLFLVVMLPFSPGSLEQWLGRPHRLGMARPCKAKILVCERTADVRRAMILADKIPDIEILGKQEGLGAVRASIMGTDDIDALLAGVIAKLMHVPFEENEATWE